MYRRKRRRVGGLGRFASDTLLTPSDTPSTTNELDQDRPISGEDSLDVLGFAPHCHFGSRSPRPAVSCRVLPESRGRTYPIRRIGLYDERRPRNIRRDKELNSLPRAGQLSL
jgi:hypothetical protein